MELRHLRYFVAVAEALSFRAGAATLHVSQPALSRQIKDLEEELGVQLIARTRPRVSLTREGASFLANAKKVVAHSAAIIKSVQKSSRKSPSALKIGYAANLFVARLPASLVAFRLAFPTIAINLLDMSYGEQLRALSAGKLDLGFAGWHRPISKLGLKFRLLTSFEMKLACAKSSPFAHKSVLQLKELKSVFFIGMSEQSYPGYRAWLTEICARANFIPIVVQDVEVEQALIHAVAAGLGVALLPEQTPSIPQENVVFRELRPEVMAECCLAWNPRKRSEPLECLIECVTREERERPRLELLLAG